jgi:hypothetical protein
MKTKAESWLLTTGARVSRSALQLRTTELWLSLEMIQRRAMMSLKTLMISLIWVTLERKLRTSGNLEVRIALNKTVPSQKRAKRKKKMMRQHQLVKKGKQNKTMLNTIVGN